MAPCTRIREQPSRVTKRISYREDVSSSDFTDSASATSSEGSGIQMTTSSRKRRPSASSSSLSQQPSTASKKRKAHPFRHRRQSLPRKKPKSRTASSTGGRNAEAAAPEVGVIPRWQELPYHILAQIFHHAFDSLYSGPHPDALSVSWLLNSARICRSFAEPALSILYFCPPIYSEARFRRFLKHLSSRAKGSSFNYIAKIKYLNYTEITVLFQTHQRQRIKEFTELISLTPHLRGVRTLDHSSDPTVATQAGCCSTHQLAGSLSTVLHAHQTHFQEWVWNVSGVAHSCPVETLKDFHTAPPFAYISRLAIIGSIYRDLAQDISHEKIAVVFNVLRHLRHLSIKGFDTDGTTLLPLLPRNLESFELTQCISLTSEALVQFLATHGQNLRQLILNHNNSLRLSFLTELAKHCPRLEVLRLDLRFPILNYVKPGLDSTSTFLFDEDVPTWPSKLQYLELLHLRGLSLSTAEMFYSSLVDSAASLPDLRYINIKASLGASGWRDRLHFREKWTARLAHVFLRKSAPPNQHLRSIRAFKEFKLHSGRGIEHVKDDDSHYVSHCRQQPTDFSHIAIDTETKSDVTLTSHQTRQSTRQKQQQQQQGPSPPAKTTKRPRRGKRRAKGSDTDSSSEEDSALDDDATTEAFLSDGAEAEYPALAVQGMCDVVQLSFDNLRPNREQLRESDFLDDEPSGDDDWIA